MLTPQNPSSFFLLTSSSMRTLRNRPKALTGFIWVVVKIGDSLPAEWAGLGEKPGYKLEVELGSSSSDEIVTVTGERF